MTAREHEKEANRKERGALKVTIVGGGKVGYYLVKTLLEHDHEPTLIECNKKTCGYIANELDIPVVFGDGTQIESLDSAMVGESKAIIAVTGEDETNLISCQLAKKIFGVPKAVAKVNNPKNAMVLKKLGVDNVINSTDSIASLIEREVDTARIKQLINLNHGEASICEIELPDHYALDGISLMKVRLPERFNIVSITRNDVLIIPRGQTILKSGDKLLIISENTALHELNEILRLDQPGS